MQAIELTITGMTCQHCVKTVTDALSSVPHVRHVAVDLERGRATVDVDEKAELSDVLNAVSDSGYRAEVS